MANSEKQKLITLQWSFILYREKEKTENQE